MVRIKFCPKCRSLNIKIRHQSFWFAGFPASYQCHNCGLKSFTFPTISMDELKKLAKGKKKKNAGRKK